MSLPTVLAKNTASKLLSKIGQNLTAQSDARHILQEVEENEANYPRFDPSLTAKSTHIAYALIACGCSIIENDEDPVDIGEGLTLLERAGKILSDNYEHSSSNEIDKSYNLLLAGMSLFAAKQYSRAFVVLNGVDVDFSIGQMVVSFIRKDFSSLIERTNEAFFSSVPKEDILAVNEWLLAHEVARCFMIGMHFIHTGNDKALVSIRIILDKLLDIAIEDGLTLYWLILRVLRTLFSAFMSASLWTVLPPFLPGSNLRDDYIRLLGTAKNPITEIWPSQIESLDKALGGNTGAIINLRTSGGKTRVAELAMLQSLSSHPDSKVLYLAPFRSLAFELEQTLSDVFVTLGFSVTHLYGGATVNLSDFELIQESNIIIATPEKAKALIRGGFGIENSIKLIVVDEGHLLGVDYRFIRNELFLSHIKEIASRKGIRVILLSAVLPNAEDLARWITDDGSLVAKSEWKPSLERTGLLLWDGNQVRLEWNSEGNPFNPNFIQKKPLTARKNSKQFPSNKNEAVAATAARLAKSGTVMIFSARATSINRLAEDVLLALGQNPPCYAWENTTWAMFENLCMEELETGSIVLEAARKGVICHSNKLTPNVRISIEKLMRSKAPLIIIASSTLGQGVNIGISTVIVGSPYYTDQPISVRDFWNICGRAGRAYSDAEGKILYAIDTKKTKQRTAWHISKDKQLANSYFRNGAMDDVKSGLAAALGYILQVANKSGVKFDRLLDLVSNDFPSNEIDAKDVSMLKEVLNLIDDELLAMHMDFCDSSDNVDWVETVFKKSLAIIQADIKEQDAHISMLRARTRGIISRIPNQTERQCIVSTGIPFTVAQAIIAGIDKFRQFGEKFMEEWVGCDYSPNELARYIAVIEKWVTKNAQALFDDNNMPTEETLTAIREDWLSGVGLAKIIAKEADAGVVVKDYYGFTLPWVLHAIAQVFDGNKDETAIRAFSTMALLVEVGLPNELTANIFLAGVRSRSAALEIAALDCVGGNTVIEMKTALMTIPKTERESLSETAQIWLNDINDSSKSGQKKSHGFSRFTIKLDREIPTELLVRENQGKYFLLTPDGSYNMRIKSTDELPFEIIANKRDLYFEYVDDAWELKSYNPRVTINST